MTKALLLKPNAARKSAEACWRRSAHSPTSLAGAAATLLRKLGGTAEVARDLAYRLYTIRERKKWAEEALVYNGLVIAWPALTKLAMATPSGTTETQQEMF